MADIKEDAAGLIEINLLFARIELSIGKYEENSTERALYHIEEALRHVRAQPTHERTCDLAPQPPQF